MKVLIQKIIELTNASSKCEDFSVTGISSLENATSNELTFFVGTTSNEILKKTKAKAIFVSHKFQENNLKKNWLYVDNPRVRFFSTQHLFSHPSQNIPFIHPQASVDPSAKLGKNVTIYPCAVIDKKAVIGDNSIIYAHSYIGKEAKVGKDCLIYTNCSIMERVVLGNRVIIHSGSVLGSDGFGFITEKDIHCKIIHQASLEVGDDVEIGANCAIDRGVFSNSKIGSGSKLDNLVHLGHNVEIGKNCLLAGQVGIAGSTKLGDNVYCGGQVGILGHNKIGKGSVMHPGSIFMQEKKEVPENSHLAGVPAIPIQEWRKNIILQKKLIFLEKRIRELEKKNK